MQQPTSSRLTVRSAIWDDFTRMTDGIECNTCGKIFSAKTSTASLSYHLSRQHIIAAHHSGLQFDQYYVDQLICQLIATSALPLKLVENPFFIALLSYLTPGYIPPHRKKLTTALLPRLRQQLEAVIKKKLANLPWLSLTVDAWTAINSQNYMAITLHGISEQWKHESFVLDVVPIQESETGHYIATMIQDVLDTWDINLSRIVAATTDGGSNFQSAISNHLHLNWVWCTAHLLNLAVQDVLELPELAPTLMVAKSIVKFFRVCELFSLICAFMYLYIFRLLLWQSVY